MADFAQILIRAKDDTKSAFDSAARNMRGLEASATKLGGLMRTVGLGAGLSVAGFAAFAKSGIDAADALNDMSQRLGVSVKDLASFKLAAEQSGTSLDGVGTGIARLSRSIGEAEGGNKKLSAALSALGVTARDPKEAFFQLADAVESIEDPNKRAALLSQVLGKSYQELVPLLAQGGDELRRSATASDSFADSMARLAPNADKFNDQMAELKQNAALAASSVLNDLVPALNRLFERFADIARLRASGASLFEIVTGGVSADTKKSLDRVNADIADLEDKRKRLGTVRNPADDAELVRLKAIRAELQAIAVEKINTPPTSAATGAASALLGGTSDFSKALSGGAKTKTAKGDTWADDMAAAWARADAELKQYAEDRDFVMQGDMERDNAINDIANAWKEAGRALENEMRTPLENANIEFARLDEMLERGVIGWETYSRAVLSEQDKIDAALNKTTEIGKDSFADLKQAIEGWGKDAASAFADWAMGAEMNIADVGKAWVREMIQMAAYKTMFEPLAAAANSAFSNFISSANGNVFSSPGLSAYSGSVVSKPTLFPFASGVGLMGEAGPEAILPLKRGANGKLGVAGGGSSMVVNIIEAPGSGGKTEQRQGDNGVNIIDVYVEKIKGSIAGDISSGRGSIPNALANTYGLNRVAGAY